MNSVSPVVSLANSTNDLLSTDVVLDKEVRLEIHQAIQAIQKRSEGLLSFTERYRKLTKVPMPQLEPIDAVALMSRVLTLMHPVLTQKGINLEKTVPEKELIFNADAEQLEQTFINLIKNAMEAVSESEEKVVYVSVERKDERVVFRIRDSGPGIPPELRDQIFIPFFTTKEEGSGIGLSLCRQIVYQHGGTLSVYSPEGEGAEFVITI